MYEWIRKRVFNEAEDMDKIGPKANPHGLNISIPVVRSIKPATLSLGGVNTTEGYKVTVNTLVFEHGLLTSISGDSEIDVPMLKIV